MTTIRAFVRRMLKRQLFNATLEGNLGEVERLLDAGASLEAKTEFAAETFSPLQIAVFYRHHAVTRLLLQRGADHSVKRRFSSKEPLHDAASWGDAVFALLLLQHGANIDALDSTLQTPLHVAVNWNYPGVVAVLLQNGASLYARTCLKANDLSIMCRASTPVDMANETGAYLNRDAVRKLLETEQIHRNVAFLMSQHARLGASSLAGALEPELARMIMQFL
jgi:ankyrin repeat protein